MSTTIRATSNETSAFSGLTPKRTRTLSFHSRGASCASTPSTLAQVAKRHRSHTGLRSIFRCGKDPHLYNSGDYHPPKKARDDEKSSVYNAAKVPQLPISQAIESHNTLGIPPSISSRSLPPVITFDEPVEGTVRLIGPSTVELSSWSLYPPSENTRLSSRDIIPVASGPIPRAPERLSSVTRSPESHPTSLSGSGSGAQLDSSRLASRTSASKSPSAYPLDGFYDPRFGVTSRTPSSHTTRSEIVKSELSNGHLTGQLQPVLPSRNSAGKMSSRGDSIRRRRRYAMPYLDGPSLPGEGLYSGDEEVQERLRAVSDAGHEAKGRLDLPEIHKAHDDDQTGENDHGGSRRKRASTQSSSVLGNESKVSESSSEAVSVLLRSFPLDDEMPSQPPLRKASSASIAHKRLSKNPGISREVSLVRQALRDGVDGESKRSGIISFGRHRAISTGSRSSDDDDQDEDESDLSQNLDDAVRESCHLVADLTFRQQMQAMDRASTCSNAGTTTSLLEGMGQNKSFRATFGEAPSVSKLSRAQSGATTSPSERDSIKSDAWRGQTWASDFASMRRSQLQSFRPGSRGSESHSHSRCSTASSVRSSERLGTPLSPPPESPLPPIPTQASSRTGSQLLKRSTFGEPERNLQRISEDEGTLRERKGSIKSAGAHRQSSRLRTRTMHQESMDKRDGSLRPMASVRRTQSRGTLGSRGGDSVRSSSTLSPDLDWSDGQESPYGISRGRFDSVSNGSSPWATSPTMDVSVAEKSGSPLSASAEMEGEKMDRARRERIESLTSALDAVCGKSPP